LRKAGDFLFQAQLLLFERGNFQIVGGRLALRRLG
jgi:hypothetical protein